MKKSSEWTGVCKIMSFRVFGKDETGSALAEFAVVAMFFFMLLLSIIEFGRLLYTHNALTDAARRGARYAALHTENEVCVKNVVMYGERDTQVGPPPTCTPIGPLLINGLDRPEVTINVVYEGADLDNDPDDSNPIDTSYGTNLGTATVTIQNFTFQMGIPLIDLNIAMPLYRTTLTAESAGEEPADE